MALDAIIAALSSSLAVVFDLDGTLYPEEDYLAAADMSVIALLARDYAIEVSRATEVLRQSCQPHREGHLTRIQQRLALPSVALQMMLEVRRTAQASISPWPWVVPLLSALRSQGRSSFIFTNGNALQQANKISLLGLDRDVSGRPLVGVVYAADYAPKPSPLGLQRILEMAEVSPAEAIMIGNDSIDEGSALAAGVSFVWVDQIHLLAAS